MKVAESAKKLEVSTSLIYDLCARGELPHVRLGSGRGTIRISESAIDAYLLRQQVTGPRSRPQVQVKLKSRMPATSSPVRLEDVARALLDASKRD